MEGKEKDILLEVRGLVTEFGTEDEAVKAVNDISFTLRRGETIGIVGESGSGKSVTSLSVMRLIPTPPGKIAAGEIHYHRPDKQPVDLLTLPEKQMRRYRGNDIAMIFQEPMTSLNPVYTCGEQVIEAILQHTRFPEISTIRHISEKIIKTLISLSLVGNLLRRLFKKGNYLTSRERKARRIALQLFDQTQLPRPAHIYESYPHQLSGGQKQRVMIAMAMSCNPQILIADEPTTALDVTVQKTILDLMNDLQARHNMGIIFITHDLGVIAEVADRVLVMYKGRIVEQGSVIDIFTNPKHPYTKGLLACRPSLNKRLKKLAVVSDFMSDNLQETNLTVEQLQSKFEISVKERQDELKKLYEQTAVLEVKNLCTWFPLQKSFTGKVTEWVKAVDDVSFDVYPGETLGLVGESGCGKTTLGRTILRLVDPHSGTVLYNGKDITRLSKAQLRPLRKDLQIIFQDPYSSLNPRMTIGEAIMEPMRVHHILLDDKARKNRVVEILERVNMRAAHFNRYPHEFSGGQRQRICIARALALHPRFIICDESVSALDVSVQAQVLNLLNELKKDFHFTYIFISHDLSVVKFMSDRMLVMNQGKIEEMGIAEEIYAHPQKDYTRKLIDAIPKGRIEDIRSNMEKRKSLRMI